MSGLPAYGERFDSGFYGRLTLTRDPRLHSLLKDFYFDCSCVRCIVYIMKSGY